jgi:hypothetical protein
MVTNIVVMCKKLQVICINRGNLGELFSLTEVKHETVGAELAEREISFFNYGGVERKVELKAYTVS